MQRVIYAWPFWLTLMLHGNVRETSIKNSSEIYELFLFVIVLRIKINWEKMLHDLGAHTIRWRDGKAIKNIWCETMRAFEWRNGRMIFMKNSNFSSSFNWEGMATVLPDSRRRSAISKVIWWIRRHENRKTWQRFSWMSFGSREFYASASRKFFLLCCRKYFLQFNVEGSLTEIGSRWVIGRHVVSIFDTLFSVTFPSPWRLV